MKLHQYLMMFQMDDGTWKDTEVSVEEGCGIEKYKEHFLDNYYFSDSDDRAEVIIVRVEDVACVREEVVVEEKTQAVVERPK